MLPQSCFCLQNDSITSGSAPSYQQETRSCFYLKMLIIWLKQGKGAISCRLRPNQTRKMEDSKNTTGDFKRKPAAPENYLAWKKKIRRLSDGFTQNVTKPKGRLLLGGLNEGVRGRLQVRESADEQRDGSSVNGIQGQEPRRWWEEIKGSNGWRTTSSGGRERRG